MSIETFSVQKLSKFAGEHTMRIINFRHLDANKSMAIEVEIDGSEKQFMVLFMPTAKIKSDSKRVVGVTLVEGVAPAAEDGEEPDVDAIFSR